MLALAHHQQDAIDRRIIADRAAVARKLLLTRAWVLRSSTCSCSRRTFRWPSDA